MKKILAGCIGIFIIVTMLTACTEVHQKNSEEYINLWTEDMEFFQKTVTEKHKNPFTIISEDEFIHQVDELLVQVDVLREDEIAMELNKIMDKIGDSHSVVGYVSDRELAIGIIVAQFEERFYIINTTQDNSELLYCEITEINGIPIGDIQEEFRNIVPSENEYWDSVNANAFLSTMKAYQGLNIIDPEDEIVLTVKNDDRVFNATVDKISFSDWEMILDHSLNDYNTILPNRLEGISAYSYEVIGDTFIVRFNRAIRLEEFSIEDQTAIMDLYANPDIKKLIIDFRGNKGGSTDTIDFFVELINSRTDIKKAKQVYSLIGNCTFSSGVAIPATLKRVVGSILVGEPTGGNPNSFGAYQVFQFPNHDNFHLILSKAYLEYYPNDRESKSLVPDVLIYDTIDDLIQETDPVIGYVLSQ